jgi:hypothetical protein
MSRTSRYAVMMATSAVAALGMSVVAQARESCVRAGGEATMITEDLAKFMAQAALKNSISGMGAKPIGRIAIKCGPNMGLTSCMARQKACK